MVSICLKPHCKKFFIILQRGILIGLLGCSGHEKSERDRLREQNARGEYIYRLHNEKQDVASDPQPRSRELYPWEKE